MNAPILEDLLKPFKDASAAWEIDIPQILDWFTEESGLCADSVDFHGAATLLRGSTNVFARKADYVYEFAMRAFMNLSLQPKTRMARRLPISKDTLSAQISDAAILPDLQEYAEKGKTCGSLKTAEELISRKPEIKPEHVCNVEIDYKIIPKQPATVLVTGDTDNTLPIATPFYRAHRDMLTGALLLETWSPDSLACALSSSADVLLKESAGPESEGNLYVSISASQSHTSALGGAQRGKPLDFTPVCTTTPLAIYHMQTRNTSIMSTNKVTAQADFLNIDQLDEHPMDSDDPPPFCTDLANIELPIDVAYAKLMGRLERVGECKVSIKSNQERKGMTYLDANVLQERREAKLKEIELHEDGFRRYVFKDGFENICQSVFAPLPDCAESEHQTLSESESSNSISFNPSIEPVATDAVYNPPDFNYQKESVSTEQTKFDSIIQKKVLELRKATSFYKTSPSILKWNEYIRKALLEEESRPQFNIESLMKQYRETVVGSHTQLSKLCESTRDRCDIVRSFAVILHVAGEGGCTLTLSEDGDIVID